MKKKLIAVIVVGMTGLALFDHIPTWGELTAHVPFLHEKSVPSYASRSDLETLKGQIVAKAEFDKLSARVETLEKTNASRLTTGSIKARKSR